MFGSVVVEVALGVIFVYLLLSIICSAMAEILETFLKNRGADLESGLRELLGDPNGTGLVKELYSHPLIAGLYRGNYVAGQRSNLPSYIPSRQFALAILDIALPQQPVLASTAPVTATGAAAAVMAPARPSLRDAVATISDSTIRRALIPIVEDAGNNYSKVVEEIEQMYNASMERVAGWYKRRTQLIVLVLGLLVAIAVNADTISIVRTLSRDPASRASLVKAAEDYAAAPHDTVDARQKLESSLTNVEQLGLPIGWDSNDSRLVPRDPAAWMLKAIGWLLTALAVSLGAPFWFDMLNKIITVRSTIKPKSKN